MADFTFSQLLLEGKSTPIGIIALLKANGIRPTGNSAIDTEAAKKVATKTVNDTNSPKYKYEQLRKQNAKTNTDRNRRRARLG